MIIMNNMMANENTIFLDLNVLYLYIKFMSYLL